MTKFTSEQLKHLKACVERELKMRQNVYPGQVRRGKMTKKASDNEITLMQKLGELVEEQIKIKLGTQGEIFEKRPGMLVVTKKGETGRTYNDESRYEGKIKVWVMSEDYKDFVLNEKGKKYALLCDPDGLTLKGFID